MIRIWIDDIRNPPSDDWIWIKTVNQAITAICMYEKQYQTDTILISVDHDAGDFAVDGGDYIRVLDWLEREGIVNTGYFFHLHTQNPVGRQNMRAIIQKNGWREVY